jgi:hypothetical protein
MTTEPIRGAAYFASEYHRRNLLVCSAYGAAAGIRISLERLRESKGAPKWLISQLQNSLDRADRLPADLAKWRDASPDYDAVMAGLPRLD